MSSQLPYGAHGIIPVGARPAIRDHLASHPGICERCLSDCIHLRMWEYICLPNFEKYPSPQLRYYYLPMSENKWLSYWNHTSGLDFDLFTVISMSVCINLPNFCIWPDIVYSHPFWGFGGIFPTNDITCCCNPKMKNLHHKMCKLAQWSTWVQDRDKR